MSAPLADAHVTVTAEIDVARITDRMRRAGELAGRAYERALRQGMAAAGRVAARAAADGLQSARGRFVLAGASAGRAYRESFQAAMRQDLGGLNLDGILRGPQQAFGQLGQLGGVAASGVSGLGQAATGAAGSLGRLGPVLLALVAVAVQLAGALAPLSGLLLALPVAGAAAAAVLGTLRVAFSGVGEAFSAALAGDVEAFEEALRRLSPAAATVARDFRSVVPAFNQVRSAVQDAFFGPLAGQLQRLSGVLLGPLRAGMVAVAGAAGQLVVELGRVLAESETGQVLGVVFGAARDAIVQLTPAVAEIARGLRDLIGVTAPLFTDMTRGIAEAGVEFGRWLQEISSGGQAFNWLQGALDRLRQVADLAFELGGVVVEALRLASGSGGEFLETLTGLAGGLRDFLAAVGPGLGQVLEPLARVGQEVLPLLQRLGGALAEQYNNVTSRVGPALGELVDALGELAEALTPVLGPIADFAVRVLGLRQAEGIAGLIRGLAAVISGLAEGITRGLAAVQEFVGWLQRLGAAVSSGFDSARTAVTGFLASLGEEFLSLPSRIGDALAELPGLLAEVFAAAARTGFEALGFGLGLLIQAVTEWPAAIGQALLGLPGVIGDAFSSALTSATSLASGAVDAVISFFAGLGPRIGAALVALPGIISAAFIDAKNAAVQIAVSLANEVASWISSIPGRVTSFAGAMFSAGQQLITSLFNGLRQVGGVASDIASRIVAGIRGALNSVIDSMNSGIRSSWPGIFGSPPQIPRFAQGGIIERQTLAILGEGNLREVVIPLTKPDRAVALARESGLVNLLAARGAFATPAPGGGGRTVHVSAPITVNTIAADPEIVARRAVDHVMSMAQA